MRGQTLKPSPDLGAMYALMAREDRDRRICICDHDADERDGLVVPLRTPASGCPVHAEEDAQ